MWAEQRAALFWAWKQQGRTGEMMFLCSWAKEEILLAIRVELLGIAMSSCVRPSTSLRAAFLCNVSAFTNIMWQLKVNQFPWIKDAGTWEIKVLFWDLTPDFWANLSWLKQDVVRCWCTMASQYWLSSCCCSALQAWHHHVHPQANAGSQHPGRGHCHLCLHCHRAPSKCSLWMEASF